MSEPERLSIDPALEMFLETLRNAVIDCLYRVEQLELRHAAGATSDNLALARRLPSLDTGEDLNAALAMIRERVSLLEESLGEP